MTTIDLIQAIAVTAELTGTQLSEGAARILADDLAAYDRNQVIGALKRCRAELRGRLTMAEVLSRLDDGRPGPDEAYAMLPTSEAQTVVWTDEIAAAASYRDSTPDRVAARAAFREAYTKAVSRAREARLPVRWWPSLGSDPQARHKAIADAVRAGRLSLDQAQQCGVLLPPQRDWGVTALLAGAPAHQLPAGEGMSL